VGVVEEELRLSRYPEIWYWVLAHNHEKLRVETAVVANIEIAPTH
jgi:hypothetical protein